jgi:hypothetical protein
MRALHDWHAVLPTALAARQLAWESRQRVLRAWNAGATLREIADALGCSHQNVHQMLVKARIAGRAPVSCYLEEVHEPAERALAWCLFPKQRAADQERIAESAAKIVVDVGGRLRNVALRQKRKQRLQDRLRVTPWSQRFHIMASDLAIGVPRRWGV